MALYAHTLLNRDTPRARARARTCSRSLPLSFIFSLPFPPLLYVAIPHSSLHLAFTDASFSPHDAPTAFVSSFSNFPRWRYRPLCFFLDTVKRLNATTSPLRFLRFSHFFFVSCEVWYAVMARYAAATQRKKRKISFRLLRAFCRIAGYTRSI